MPPSSTPTENGAPPPADDAGLLPLVQQTLQQGAGRRAFAPALEARFEADTGAERSRQLVRLGLASLAVYNLFLVNDAIARPDALAVALLYRAGVMGGLGAVVLALVGRGLQAPWREGLMGGVLVLAMFCSCQIFAATTGPAATYDPFLFGLIFLVGNIVFALRLREALASSAAGLVVAGAYVLGNPGVPPLAQQFSMALMAAIAVFTALASFRMETATRHGYLLLLQEALRSQAAQRRAAEYAHISHTDALTQLHNRRAFDAALQQRWHEAAQRGDSLALLLVDVDHFKLYNDRYGHPAGDECLRQVARAMAGAVRQGDLLARIGGEEFAILLDAVSPLDIANAAERLRAAVQAMALEHAGNGAEGVVTVSVGGAWAAAREALPAQSLVDLADGALYVAKRGGRNRCGVAAD